MYAKRRKKSNAKAIVAVVVLILLAVGLLLNKVVFVVRSVEYTGSSTVSTDEITRASGIRLGGSIFSIREDEIRRSVNALGSVVLERIAVHYPSTVTLQIRPRTAAGMFLYSGGLVIMDDEGYVIRQVTDVPDADLLYVIGLHAYQCRPGSRVETKENQIEGYAAVAKALAANDASVYVSELNLEDPQNMYIITRSGITVELGDASNMNNKIAYMKGAVADLEIRSQFGGTLDVRSGNKGDYRAPVSGENDAI